MARWRGLAVALLVASGCIGTTPARAELLQPRAGDDALVEAQLASRLTELLDRYRDLHAHPELSGEEKETAAKVASRLEKAGFEVTTGVGGHGVVGVLGNGAGPTLLLRGDMDGLPVREATGLPYASRVEKVREDGSRVGVMHACGHDVHIANLVASAEILAALRGSWSGSLVVVAQPAEEIGAGARDMIGDGLFERFPRPDFALALHVEAELPAGHLGWVSGFATANVDSVDIVLHGRGGHGARPHQTADPVVAAAHLVTALQTLVSRRVDPLDPAVVTVGSIQGGAKHNVIPDQVALKLTVRSYSDEVRELLLSGIRQLARDTCDSFQCTKPPEVRVKEHYTPAAYNDPGLVAEAVEIFEALVGEERVHALRPSMGGEDFGRYARALSAPGFQFRLGSAPADAEEPRPSLHSSRYAPDPEPTLRTGVRATVNLALAILRP